MTATILLRRGTPDVYESGSPPAEQAFGEVDHLGTIQTLFTHEEPCQRRYNESMARGWESKSVEAQMEEANSESSANPGSLPVIDRQATFRKKDLQLSRKRILQQLESSSNERYSELLRRTLADLDAQIDALA
jgi:hypothetical protein